MITLIGHGYVGNYISKELTEQNIKFNHITHKDKVPTNTHLIINAAGYTGIPNVDTCESNKDECVSGNILFPLELERDSISPIIHISSGCVYDGYKDGGWLETDEPNFAFDKGSFYSATKVLEQKLLALYLEKRSYLLRIRLPFGSDTENKNLLVKLFKYEKLMNYRNSITNMEEFSKCVVHFATNKQTPGIYNAVNTGSITTEDIVSVMGWNKEYMTDEEFKKITIAPRSNCILNTDKMQSVFQFKPAIESLQETASKINLENL